MAAGGPTRASTECAVSPGEMAEKSAQPPGSTAKASTAAARRNAAIMASVALAVARIDLETRNPLERARGSVELDVKLHVAHPPLAIAPGPYLFIVEVGKADVPRSADQPAHFVAGHAQVQLGDIFLAQHLADFPHRAVAPQRHHVGFDSERPERIFPDLGTVCVLPDRARGAELRLDLLRRCPGRQGGKIRASREHRGERKRKKGVAGRRHRDNGPIKWGTIRDATTNSRARLRKHRHMPPYSCRDILDRRLPGDNTGARRPKLTDS